MSNKPHDVQMTFVQHKTRKVKPTRWFYTDLIWMSVAAALTLAGYYLPELTAALR